MLTMAPGKRAMRVEAARMAKAQARGPKPDKSALVARLREIAQQKQAKEPRE